MDKFYGFDLGDAESAVSLLEKGDHGEPQILEINEQKSLITAYALLRDGTLIIGENACYEPDAVQRKIRFKSRYLVNPESSKDIRSFAAGVLGELYLSGSLIKGEDSCFYVGCPAGWNKAAREDYREIFEKAGYPPTKIISESRAALVSACQSKHLQVGYDILSRPVLVVDIGSSTTDFAYIMGGKEVELQTGGEVFLGGGIMDEILLDESLKASPDEKKIRKIFAESEAWKTYCEFAARRLKEKYFSDEEYWKKNDCVQNVSIRAGFLPTRLTLRMNEKIAGRLLDRKMEKLDDRSFREVFIESLRNAKANIEEKEPELIFLTGGVSKMPAIKVWCQEVFPDAVIISGSEPEFSVSKGLAYCGRIDDQLREFKEDIENLKASTAVEKIVERHLDSLYHSAVDTMTSPILTNVAAPVIEKWRDGTIEKLSDIDGVLQNDIDVYLHSDDARKLLTKVISGWLKEVSYELEEYTMPICIKHNVPYSALNLTSYLSAGDINIKVETKNLFMVEEITWMIDTLVSLLVGFLCGGSGIALIANGLPGIVAGAVISLLVLALGKDKMQEVILNMNIPTPARKMLPKSIFTSRLEKVTKEVKDSLYKNLEEEKNEEITERLVKEISEQIETCLTRMAEVVEIPIG